MADWTITPLEATHDRTSFLCGEPSLDRFLKEFARQNEAKDFSRTYVLVRPEESRVVGYYTLAAGQIERENMPPGDVKKLPKYPVPVIVLARLAVDQTLKGEKLGRFLLWDALNRSLRIADEMGIYAVVVDAIDETAAAFYQHFLFTPLPDQPLKLIRTMAGIRKAMRGGSGGK